MLVLLLLLIYRLNNRSDKGYPILKFTALVLYLDIFKLFLWFYTWISPDYLYGCIPGYIRTIFMVEYLDIFGLSLWLYTWIYSDYLYGCIPG